MLCSIEFRKLNLRSWGNYSMVKPKYRMQLICNSIENKNVFENFGLFYKI